MSGKKGEKQHKMKIISKKENKLVFSAEMENGIANAIRRYVYQIPTVAVDEVEISKNDSALYDETIAHRLGLISLKAKKDKGKLKLKAKKKGFVYAEELHGDAEVIYGKTPLTLLDEDQEIELKASLRAGVGAEHSKFTPGIMFFRNEAEIIADKSLKDRLQKLCPNAEITDKSDKIIIKDNGEKEISDVCEGIVEKAGKKAEIKETGNIIFSVESFGQIKAQDIFKKSIEMLEKDLEKVAKGMK